MTNIIAGFQFKDHLFLSRDDGTLWEYWEDEETGNQNWKQLKLPPEVK